MQLNPGSDLSSPLSGGLHGAARFSPSPCSSVDSSASCWICLDEDKPEALLENVCGCRTRHVHASCLIAWIDRSDVRHCRVCTKEFPPVFSSSLAKIEAPPVQQIPRRWRPGRSPMSSRLTRTTPGERHCMRSTAIMCIGFLYGFLYAAASGDLLHKYLVSIMCNTCIAGFLCYSYPISSGIQYDLCTVVSVYVGFFVAWLSAWQTVVNMSWDMYVGEGMVAHAINFLSCAICVALRCFCFSTRSDL